MRFTRHATSLLAATGTAALALAVTACAATTPSTHPTCTDHHVPVTLPNGTAEQVQARLCLPGGASGGSVRAVEVLLPDRGSSAATWTGAAPGTENGSGERGRTSWIWTANRSGFATLAVDPPGRQAGASYPDQAAVAHQFVEALRRGALGASFRRVVLVGQGVGGEVAWQEAGTWTDVDALVLLGVAPTGRQAGETDPGGSNPGGSGGRVGAAGVTSRVRARVLVVVGDHDEGLCGRRECSAVRSAVGEPLGGECSRWFPAAGWCGVYVAAGAGHDVLVGRGAAATFVRVSGWVTQAVGPLPAARTGCAYPCPVRTDRADGRPGTTAREVTTAQEVMTRAAMPSRRQDRPSSNWASGVMSPPARVSVIQRVRRG